MSFQFKKITAVESLTSSVRKEGGAYVSTTSNNGNVKLNETACKLIGVPFGAVVTEHKADAGVRVDFKRFEIQRAGVKTLVDAMTLLPLGSEEGNKLASAGKIEAGSLQCSSAKLWEELGGNEQTLKVYEISKENAVLRFEDENGETATLALLEKEGFIEGGKYTALAEEAGLGTAGQMAEIYYVLVFLREDAKREVTKSDKPRKNKKAEGATVAAADGIDNPFASDGLDADNDGALEENVVEDAISNPFGE